MECTPSNPHSQCHSALQDTALATAARAFTSVTATRAHTLSQRNCRTTSDDMRPWLCASCIGWECGHARQCVANERHQHPDAITARPLQSAAVAPPRAHLAELAADLLWQVLPQAAEHGHLEGRDRVHDLLEPNRELPHPAGSNPASTHSAWKRAWLQPGSARPSGLGASPPMRMRFTTLASVAEPSGAVRSLQFFHWTSQQNSMRTRKRDQHMLAAPASHRSRLRTAVPAQAAALQTRALDQASQTPHVKSMGQAGAPECPGVPLSLTLAPHSSLWCTLGYFSPRDARRSGQ